MRGVSFNPATSLAWAANADHTGGTLTVDDGFQSANLTLLGNYTAASFAFASDGHGGTLVTGTATADPAAAVSNLAAHPA